MKRKVLYVLLLLLMVLSVAGMAACGTKTPPPDTGTDDPDNKPPITDPTDPDEPEVTIDDIIQGLLDDPDLDGVSQGEGLQNATLDPEELAAFEARIAPLGLEEGENEYTETFESDSLFKLLPQYPNKGAAMSLVQGEEAIEGTSLKIVSDGYANDGAADGVYLRGMRFLEGGRYRVSGQFKALTQTSAAFDIKFMASGQLSPDVKASVSATESQGIKEFSFETNVPGNDYFITIVCNSTTAVSAVFDNIKVERIDNPSTVEGLTISEHDGVLEAEYVFSDLDKEKEGATLYQWYKTKRLTVTTDKVKIEGAVQKTYTPTAQDDGSYFTVEVSPVNERGVMGITSSYTHDERYGTASLPVAENLEIAGVKEVGQRLTLEYDYVYPSAEEGETEIEWFVSRDPEGKEIVWTGIEGAQLTVTSEMAPWYIGAQVMAVAQNGEKGELQRVVLDSPIVEDPTDLRQDGAIFRDTFEYFSKISAPTVNHELSFVEDGGMGGRALKVTMKNLSLAHVEYSGMQFDVSGKYKVSFDYRLFGNFPTVLYVNFFGGGAATNKQVKINTTGYEEGKVYHFEMVTFFASGTSYTFRIAQQNNGAVGAYYYLDNVEFENVSSQAAGDLSDAGSSVAVDLTNEKQFAAVGLNTRTATQVSPEGTLCVSTDNMNTNQAIAAIITGIRFAKNCGYRISFDLCKTSDSIAGPFQFQLDSLTTSEVVKYDLGAADLVKGEWKNYSFELASKNAADYRILFTTATTNDAASYEIKNIRIERVNMAPVISDLTIEGTAGEGNTLTARYDYFDYESDAESGTTFQWFRSVSPNGENPVIIEGAEQSVYTMTGADAGYYIGVVVVPHDSAASVGGKYSAVCQTKFGELVVSIDDLQVVFDNDYASATASYTYTGDTTEFEYRWYVTDLATDGQKIYLADQTGQTLPVIQSYKGWYLGVEVSNVNGTSAVFSAVSEEPCGGSGTRQLAQDGDVYYNNFAYFADAQAQKEDTQISVEEGSLVFTFGSVGATPVRLATSAVLSGGAKYRLSFDYSFVKANGSNPGTMLVQFMTGDVSQTRSMKIGSNTVIVNEDGSYHVDFVVTLLNSEGYYVQIGLQDGQNWAGVQFKVRDLRIENISATLPETGLSEAGASVTFLQDNGVAMSAANTKTEVSVIEEEGEEIYEIRKTSVGQGALAVYFTGMTFETGTYTITFEYKNVGTASAPGPGVVQITSASNNAATVKAPNIPLGAGDHAKLNVWAATEATLSVSKELPADALLQFTTSAFADRDSAVQLRNIVITKTA